jgi:hypothetical protein
VNLKMLFISATLLSGVIFGAAYAEAAPADSNVPAAAGPRAIYMPVVANNRAASSGVSVYSGISIEGVPWDMSKLTNWEQSVSGKPASIVQFWLSWRENGQYQPFVPSLVENIRQHGSIPMISWTPEEWGAGPNQPDFQLTDIINGQHDQFINQWAAAAKAWGHPFFLRWAHEPDGNWFPWGEDANGNKRGEYVLAWRHVHDLFSAVGATNATWVWCPNVQWALSPRPSYASLYPGDAYVDWTCVDGYNWGTNYPSNGGWISFDKIFRYAYNEITKLAPNKPLMLGEWGSSEVGGSKADWIRDTFSVQIPNNYPKIKAEVWYNWIMSGVDWRVESSTASSAAYRAAMADGVYVGAQPGLLLTSPIPPPY